MLAMSEPHDVAAFEPRAMAAWCTSCPHERRSASPRGAMSQRQRFVAFSPSEEWITREEALLILPS